MMFLWLLMVTLFVVALGYFALLCLLEVAVWLRASRRTEQVSTLPATPPRLGTAELRFMTHEFSALFGFGDD